MGLAAVCWWRAAVDFVAAGRYLYKLRRMTRMKRCLNGACLDASDFRCCACVPLPPPPPPPPQNMVNRDKSLSFHRRQNNLQEVYKCVRFCINEVRGSAVSSLAGKRLKIAPVTLSCLI